MKLSLEGIGAVLRSEGEYTQVVRIITGGPADIDGRLAPDDRVIGVKQEDSEEMVDVIGWRLDDVVDLSLDVYLDIYLKLDVNVYLNNDVNLVNIL